MTTIRMKPPQDGTPGTSVWGCRYYTSEAGKTIDVPLYDVAAFEEAGWQQADGLASLSAIPDGNRLVLRVTNNGVMTYVGAGGFTADIAQASDVRGPSAIPDASGDLTLDPQTGDVSVLGN